MIYRMTSTHALPFNAPRVMIGANGVTVYPLTLDASGSGRSAGALRTDHIRVAALPMVIRIT
jgi:hypothetical protein